MVNVEAEDSGDENTSKEYYDGDENASEEYDDNVSKENVSEEYDDGDESVSKKDHFRLTDGLSDCLWELSHVGVLHIL